MGLTVSRKRDNNSAIRRKSHYFIETLLACFHASPLSGSSFTLEFKNAVFFNGRETLGLKHLEKDPGTKARTNKSFLFFCPGNFQSFPCWYSLVSRGH